MGRINQDYLRDSIRENSDRLIAGFGSIASIISLAFAVLVQTFPSNAIVIAAYIFWIFATVVFLLLFIYFQRRSRSGWKYVLAYQPIAEGFAEFHKDDYGGLKPEAQMEIMQNFCSKVSEAFSIITGKDVGTCIKYMKDGSDMSDFGVTTFCRDQVSDRNDGRKAPNVDQSHLVSQNRDFEYIFLYAHQDGENFRYFFSNSLPTELNYYNSRLDTKVFPPLEEMSWKTKRERIRKWSLSYASTIVVPIIPLSDKNFQHDNLLGFLCIDTKERKGFRKKYDTIILRGIADGLYPYLKITNLRTAKV